MTRSHLLAAATLALALSACASQRGFIADRQEAAVQTALARGKFDLACPPATGTVLSSNYLPKETGGAYAGADRAEYAIGVAGCDKRATYVVVCPDKSDACAPATPDGK